MSRTALIFSLLTLLLAVLFVADLAVGSVAIAPAEVWNALTGGACDPATRDIILKIRLLKAITALAAGAALAASGLEMQTLFRNPLAGPYVLGVSSGARSASPSSCWGLRCWVSAGVPSSSRSASSVPHGSAPPSYWRQSWPSAAASRISWSS